MTSERLEGRSALVTGGASGIGLAVTTHLANLGAAVLINDLPGEALERAAGGITSASAVAADLSTRAGALEVAEVAHEVDILVNNAGLQHVSPVDRRGRIPRGRLLELHHRYHAVG